MRIQVLVEGPNPKNAAEAMGRISHNKLCFFPGSGEALKGKLVNVHIDQVRAYTLSGHMTAVEDVAALPEANLREVVLV